MKRTVPPLEEWVIVVQDGQRGLLGVPQEENGRYVGLEPVYQLEGAMSVLADQRQPGRVVVQTPIRISAVLGLVSLQRLAAPSGLPRIRITDLAPDEIYRIRAALLATEDVLRKVRAERAGVQVVDNMPDIRRPLLGPEIDVRGR